MSALVEAVRAALRASGRRPAVAAHDAWGASGLELALPETALLCLQRSGVVDVLRSRGVDVFCLSEEAGPDAVAGASTLELLQHEATRAWCAARPPLALLAFKPTERLQAAAAGLGATLVAGAPAAARAAENKLAFVDLAQAAGVPTPRWEVVPREAVDLERLGGEWGLPLVVQGPRGNAGQRTWPVRDGRDLERLLALEPAPRLRVAEWVEGMPFTATALSAPGAAGAAIPPCRQVTSVTWLTPEPLGSCGNAWGEPRLRAVEADVARQVAALADELARRGYEGVFGVDFVLGPGGPVVIEVNPRMVASLPVATQLEVLAGRPPLLLHALAAGLGLVAPPAAQGEPMPDGSQLIVHELARRPGPAPGLASGVYRLDPAGPRRARDGAWLTDLQAGDEALLVTRSPGEAVSPGREFARVYLRSAAAENTPGVRALVDALRAADAA